MRNYHKYPSISMKSSKHAVSKNFFGPFISAQAVKATIKDLQKIYQIRNCSDTTFNNRSRPCIEHQMQRCSAPCVNLISEIRYQGDILSVKLPGTDGEFEILNNHAAIISTLTKGEIKVKIDNENNEIFKINGGVIEMQNNNIIVLAN